MNTKVKTPLQVLSEKYGKPIAYVGIEELFKMYAAAFEVQATEVVKHYAAWLQHRPNIQTSHLTLCRLWFVCEMGLAGDDQDEMEASFFA